MQCNSAKLCKLFGYMECKRTNETAKRGNETKLKGNGEVSWYGVNDILVAAQDV